MFPESGDLTIPSVDEIVSSDTSGMLKEFPEIIEVTIPIQCLVEDSRLNLFAGSKSDLAGFFDPVLKLNSPEDDGFASPDKKSDNNKHLLIRYSYQGNLHQVIIPDEEGIRIPKNTHRINTC